jgi:hypothetical protein
MNDARIIEAYGIFEIGIARAINDTQNSNSITVEFSQTIRTRSKPDGSARSGGAYIGKVCHRFGVKSFQEAWPEILRRAKAYQEIEAQLAEGQ